MDENNIQVIKRDETTEKFDPGKIIRIAIATGLKEDEAAKIADNITQWIHDQKKDKVTSLEISQKFTEELMKVRKYSAEKYIWYQKTKEMQNTPPQQSD